MRFSRIVAAVAVPLALAGAVATTAASSASAAPAAPAATASAHIQAYRLWHLQRPNQVKLTYQGGTYTYQVRFAQQYNYQQPWFAQKDELLTGTLKDSYLPGNLPVNGVVFGNHVVFSVVYPGVQGVRTFSGAIDQRGNVTGTWTETGSEAGSGPFSLVLRAR